MSLNVGCVGVGLLACHKRYNPVCRAHMLYVLYGLVKKWVSFRASVLYTFSMYIHVQVVGGCIYR